MAKRISLTDAVQQSLFDEQHADGGKLIVVHMDFVEAEEMRWEELFAGFDKLYAITYSSGVAFICALLKHFQYAEVIFGFEDIISYDLQEIIAYQFKTIERLRNESSKTQIDLLDRIDNEQLRLYVSKKRLSHEKIYLLEAVDGRKRVVMGSANMSYAAFSGRQRENICYVDGDRAFDWYKDNFDELKETSSDHITAKALRIADSNENINEIPVLQTIKIKKAMIIEPEIDAKDDVRFILDAKALAKKLGPYMPTSRKKGSTVLSPEVVLQTKRRVVEANVKEKEMRQEYPRLVIDVLMGSAKLNDQAVDLNPSQAEIENDVGLFIEYMQGFLRFHGDVANMQLKYYAFANWFFTSPFMAAMRNLAIKYNQNLLPYPVFGLVYGKSKAGKTSFLETLLKMMIGQKPKIAAIVFTRSNIDGLKRTVEGAPIIVDDLTQGRFNQHAVETIKNDDFGVAEDLTTYPAVVISANEDVKAVAPEIIRRTVLCHVEAGLKNTELMKTSVVRRVQKSIGTAMYREYLRRMLSVIPQLMDEIKDDESEGSPDILEYSSKIIHEIIMEHFDGQVPSYVRILTLEDYFGERTTGSQAIKKIQTAWQTNRKAFDVNRKHSQLIYNAGQTYEADRILKELPEDLEASRSRECVVMDLDTACEFFCIDFKKNSWIRRIIG